eukprot:860937-Pleurochrysis_carterae.AAC.1
MDPHPRERHEYHYRRAAFVTRMCPRLGMVDFSSCACLSIGSRQNTCGPTMLLVMWSIWTHTSA